MNRIGIVIFLLMQPMVSFAHFDQKDIAEIQKKLQNGKSFNETDSYPSDKVQVLVLETGLLTYYIDFRTKLCFGGADNGGHEALAVIPCNSLKTGYPLLAPLLTWEPGLPLTGESAAEPSLKGNPIISSSPIPTMSVAPKPSPSFSTAPKSKTKR